MLPKIIIGLIVVLVVGVVAREAYLRWDGYQRQYNTPTGYTDASSEEPPVLIKHIGFELDYYDPKTNRAGDILFTPKTFGPLPPIDGFGHWVSAELSPTGKTYRNPQPGFRVPRGTKIRALIDGIVVAVPQLYSGDYSVMVAPYENSRWRYETEHVDNPIVKPGDRVKAGQVVAEASSWMMRGNPDWAGFEIGILKGNLKDEGPKHVCPFAYLDPSIRENTFAKLKALYKAYAEYSQTPSEYDEKTMPIPGCLTLDVIDG